MLAIVNEHNSTKIITIYTDHNKHI